MSIRNRFAMENLCFSRMLQGWHCRSSVISVKRSLTMTAPHPSSSSTALSTCRTCVRRRYWWRKTVSHIWYELTWLQPFYSARSRAVGQSSQEGVFWVVWSWRLRLNLSARCLLSVTCTNIIHKWLEIRSVSLKNTWMHSNKHEGLYPTWQRHQLNV